ncbi:hypothetical protein C8D88_1011847 [Lentzea atacamensis]|uniref:DUF6292 domain-containing protein n=2 Tax=Lentzea TaxID=165301 RepID=A0A316IMW5_9PSEU|nr:DUF6292 family protein [Lentzea atacamensis]PWK91808.1 hypothetical protein C8D88_1011847 [Lentzea atacamensis]
MTATVPTSEGTHLLTGALERYVRKVAEALGVPRDGASFEVTDTATAYIALGCRAVAHPDRDVMLVWSATQGWAVSIETDPAEPLIVLARLSGDIVQAPEAVAGFVTESMTRAGDRQPPAADARPMGWSDLAECMERYAPDDAAPSPGNSTANVGS